MWWTRAPDLTVRPGAKAAITSIVGDVGTSLLRTLGVVILIAAVAVAVAVLIRHWRRADLIVVAAVLTGVVIIGLLGLTIVSLLLAVAAAVGTGFLIRHVWTAPAVA